MKLPAIFAKSKPVDPRLRIPCTSLPAVVDRLRGEGKRVVGLERKRKGLATDYLLTVTDL